MESNTNFFVKYKSFHVWYMSQFKNALERGDGHTAIPEGHF